MPADDALLFIDANKYLDLYRIDKGKQLLAPLGEQLDYIFVTQQVVGEVQRNKIAVAAEFLGQKFQQLKLPTFNVPDHLSSASAEQVKDILQQRREIGQKITRVNDAVEALGLGIIEQISYSEDEVSKALAPIFAKATLHSPKELQRARDRREVGNPPGKSTNPIGDQLTWEQILTHFKGKKRLWIISRDSDYGTIYGGKGFLNHFLYKELCKVASAPEVYLFTDLIKGLEHFVDTTGVKAEKRLTPEDAEEIEKEEKSLPYSIPTNNALLQALADIREAGQPNSAIRQALADIREASQPNSAIRQALADIRKQPYSTMLRAAGGLYQPPTPADKSPTADQEEKDEQSPTLPPLTQKGDNEKRKDEEGKTEEA